MNPGDTIADDHPAREAWTMAIALASEKYADYPVNIETVKTMATFLTTYMDELEFPGRVSFKWRPGQIQAVRGTLEFTFELAPRLDRIKITSVVSS